MTIYSQHAHRGKTQILATFHGPAGVTSATVTSVDAPALAAPIVDALNRISACATVPVSEWDERRRVGRYPTDHLAALTDRDARPHLLEGAHSLWYTQVTMLLHRVLADLDSAVAAVPAPVRTAIGAELAAEARGLRDELAEFADGVEPPEPEKRRVWEFGSPFVVAWLDHQDRDKLNTLEQWLPQPQLDRAVANLRLLLDAHQRCANGAAQLFVDRFEISDDPDGERFYLNVQAPMPDGKWGRTDWNVEMGHWVPDEDGDTGEPILDCARSERPALPELVGLLNRGEPDVLAAWAKTPVGDPLAGTAFVVTNRYKD